MLPYLATIVVLTILSSRTGRHRLAAPGCLGKPFQPA
jgi:simple sugar transport system permease protein